MLRRKTSRQIMKSFSVTRKSRTSACRRSMCSTRKMPHNLSSARKLPGAADVVAADAAAVDAAGVAAGAVAVVAAVGLPGGARPGVIAAGVRRNSWRRKRAVSTALGSSVFAAITSAGCRNLLQCAASHRGSKAWLRSGAPAHPRNRRKQASARRYPSRQRLRRCPRRTRRREAAGVMRPGPSLVHQISAGSFPR